MYTYNKKVLFSDVDATRKMSFGSLMDAMQDCVNINSESVGRGIDYMLEHKRTWFAIGYQCGFAYAIALMVNQFGALLTGSGNVLGVIVGAALLAVIVYMLVKPYKEATKLTTNVKV